MTARKTAQPTPKAGDPPAPPPEGGQPKAKATKGKVPFVYVTVEDVTYPPGKPLPAGVAEKIANPKVWQKPAAADDGELVTDGDASDDDA